MKVIAGGVAVEYQDEGSGPVILMLHGWQDSLRSFDALASKLVESHRIVRLDFPGFGQSAYPRTDWSVGEYANCVRELLEKIGVTPEVIIGHSFGGRVALKGLETHAFQANKLILIGAAGVKVRSASRNRLIMTIAKAGNVVLSLPGLSRFKKQARASLYSAIGSDYNDAGKLKETFKKTVSEDLSSAAQVVSVPTLLIWGEQDEETPLKEGQRMHSLISGSELVVIPSATHFVHQEKPEVILEHIAPFL